MTEPSPPAGSQRPARTIEPPERCSVQAGQRGDPLLGTAFPASRLLLVEQPGPWGRAGLAQSRFDRTTAHRLIARLDPQHVRVIAVRRPGRSSTDRRRWAVVDCRPGREGLVWGRFDTDQELLDLDVDAVLAGRLARGSGAGSGAGLGGSGRPATVDEDPLYAVCAHGTHDVCCALMGRPVAAAFDDARPGRVWECSHVGGDRFAANVLVLPTGLLYGRVGAHAVGALADATDRGVVLDQYLRGRVGFAPEVQAAMAFAHGQSPGLRVRDVRFEGLSSVGPDMVAVRLDCAGRIADVRVQSARADPNWLTCQAAQPARATVYQPLSIAWADPGDTPEGAGHHSPSGRNGQG